MKRILSVLLVLLFCIVPTGCCKEPSVFEKDGFTVDLEAGTITKGGDVYTFTITGSGNRSRIDITYPNGAGYYWEWNGNGGHGGWSNDYDPVRYVDGETLMDLLSFEPPRERSGNPLLGLLFIVLGLADAISPDTAWYLSYGWRYKNAEPSDAALAFGRIGGVLAVLVGILCLFL